MKLRARNLPIILVSHCLYSLEIDHMNRQRNTTCGRDNWCPSRLSFRFTTDTTEWRKKRGMFHALGERKSFDQSFIFYSLFNERKNLIKTTTHHPNGYHTKTGHLTDDTHKTHIYSCLPSLHFFLLFRICVKVLFSQCEMTQQVDDGRRCCVCIHIDCVIAIFLAHSFHLYTNDWSGGERKWVVYEMVTNQATCRKSPSPFTTHQVQGLIILSSQTYWFIVRGWERRPLVRVSV